MGPEDILLDNLVILKGVIISKSNLPCVKISGV